MKKKLLGLITGVIVASTIVTPVASTVTVQAAQTGWVRSGNNWRYYGKDGKAYTGWHIMGKTEGEKTSHWSYFGNDGNLRTGWVQLGKGTKDPDGNKAKHWSYFGGNGWLRTGWIKLGKGTSEPDGNSTPHWSYFGDNGWLREGWQQLGKGTNNPDGNAAKHWSYFGGNGWLRTGLQYMGKGTGNPDGNAANHMSFFGDNGWLVVNKEINISGNRYKADSKGWLTQMMKVIFMDGLGNEISTQYVEKGKNATPPQNPTRSGYEFAGWDKSYNNITAYTTIIAKWVDKTKNLKYNYDFKFFNQPYSEATTALFIETNNPDPASFSVKYYKSDGTENGVGVGKINYHDLSYAGDEQGNSGSLYMELISDSMDGDSGIEVTGGYVYTTSLQDHGETTIEVTELTRISNDKNSPDYYRIKSREKKKIGKITVKDFRKEQDKWANDVISKVSNGSNTKKEQMQAITKYLASIAKYRKNYIDKNGERQYLNLIVDQGVPSWVSNEWDSYSSPAYLCYFGEKTGYPLHNMYGDYTVGTAEWQKYHFYAKSTQDGTLYQFCPSSLTNRYDNIHSKADVKKIDCLKYNKYYKMTPIK